MAALDFPTSPTLNDTYTDDQSAVWRWDGEKWNVITSDTRRLFSGAKLTLASQVNLTTTNTAVSFDTEEFDVNTFYDSGNASRLTVPDNAYYRIAAELITSGDGSSYTIVIKKNGTTDLSSTTAGPNQTVVYDNTVLLTANDYVEVYASETSGTGDINTNSKFEIHRLGKTVATAVSAHAAFSGVRSTLTSAEATTSTNTAIAWDTTDFNVNADVLGSAYWASGTPSRLTVKTAGYYRAKSYIASGTAGGANTYQLVLTKNGTTDLTNAGIDANDFLELDEIFSLAADDYLELYVKNTDNTGEIATTTYLELVRLGVT